MVEVKQLMGGLPEGKGPVSWAPSAGRVPSGGSQPVEPSGALIWTVDGGSSCWKQWIL